MNDQERITLLLEVLHINAQDLSLSVGLSRSSINDIQRGHTKHISRHVAHLINNKYPGISFDWLLKGEGEVYADGRHYEPHPPVEGLTAASILTCIYSYYKTNANRLSITTGVSPTTLSHLSSGKGNTKNITETNALRILRVYPELSHKWLTAGTGPMFSDGRDYTPPTNPTPKHKTPHLSLSRQVELLTQKLADMEARLNSGMVAEEIQKPSPDDKPQHPTL